MVLVLAVWSVNFSAVDVFDIFDKLLVFRQFFLIAKCNVLAIIST